MTRVKPPSDALAVRVLSTSYREDSFRERGKFGSWYDHHSSQVDGVVERDDTESYHPVFLLPKESTEAHVVSMIYTTGDSFGHSTGNLDIIHVSCDLNKAEAIAKQIRENAEKYTIDIVDDFGREITIKNCGAGYFERIEAIYVESFPIGKSKKEF